MTAPTNYSGDMGKSLRQLCAAFAAATVLVVTNANGATLVHAYSLNGSPADAFGGPAATLNGGTFGTTGYAFNTGTGLSFDLESTLATDYSIAMRFSLDNLSGYRKLIDFVNRASDNGFYNLNSALDFYPVAAGSTTYLPGQEISVVLTRDGATGLVSAYLNGVLQLSFTDSSNLAVATTAGGFAHFNLFQDDLVTSGGEASSGFADEVNFFQGALTAAEVPGALIPEPATVAFLLLGGLAAGMIRRRRTVE